MKTNYGHMPIAIGPDGHARMVRGGVGGGAIERDSLAAGGHQNSRTRPSGSWNSRELVANPAPSPTAAVDGFDSKLEALRYRYLSMLVLAGEVKRFKYHPFSVPIGPGKRYTPDFLVEYPDRLIVIEEVKGDLQMKNARDSVTRLHVAAGLLPMFVWRLVVGEAMEERVIA